MENVEVARESFALLNRSLAEGTDDYLELLDSKIEWIPITAHLDGRAYRGPEGVRRWMNDLMQAWEVYETRWNQALDLGDGQVLVFGTWLARGRRGGVELSFEQAAWLIELEGGKLRRLQTFIDRAEALEAAGLRE